MKYIVAVIVLAALVQVISVILTTLMSTQIKTRPFVFYTEPQLCRDSAPKWSQPGHRSGRSQQYRLGGQLLQKPGSPTNWGANIANVANGLREQVEDFNYNVAKGIRRIIAGWPSPNVMLIV